MKKLVATLLLWVLGTMACMASDPRSLGTTYLPLDHWAYPAIERAIAKGALPRQFLGQRPWTRMAVARLVRERQEDPKRFSGDNESLILVHSLESEFQQELQVLHGDPDKLLEVQNVYTRVTGISGTPIRDTYHVGQTITNDYGRPYGEGFNDITGGTVRGTYNAFGFQAQAEYQHGASDLQYNAAQQAILATRDHAPTALIPDPGSKDNAELMDTYVSATWKRTYFSFGRESNWWGPGESSAMLMSNNIAPLYMAKLDIAEPIRLPWILKYLGEFRYQMFMAKLKGHVYPRQPYLHGEKVSLMPTQNLEIGLTRTTIWAGFGHPITLGSLARTYFSVGDQKTSDLPGRDPGDRRGGLDVTYKFPGLRNWLSIYMDSFVDDDPSPLSAPHRAAFHPGFYLSHIPGLPKFDLRAEGAYTQLATEPNNHGHFFYTNPVYLDGYTSQALLIGDWVGREGKGGQLSTTYWAAPDRTIQVFWRNHMIAPDFIPGGAHRNDIGATLNYALGHHVQLETTLQFERYNIPFVSSSVENNTVASVGLTYWFHQPHKH